MKTQRLRLAFFAAGTLLFLSPIHAQSEPTTSGEAESQTRMNQHLAEAERLRADVGEDHDSPAAKELKRLEALELIHAAYLGDESQKSRRDVLLDELRGEESLDPQHRLEIVAGLKNLEVFRNAELSNTERTNAHEQVVRQLIAEFPEVEMGYQSLLGIAMAKPEEDAIRIAGEILENPNAPGKIKKAAWDLRDRYQLVGQTLADLVPAAEEGAPDLEHTRGRSTIVYSWVSDNPLSLLMAQKVADQASPDSLIIGVNLDADPETGKNAAGSENLPGQQIYGFSESGGAVRWALKMGEASLVYVTDSEGILRSVSAQRNLPDLLPRSQQ